MTAPAPDGSSSAGGEGASGSGRVAALVFLALVIAVASGGGAVWTARGVGILDRGTIVTVLIVLFAVGVTLATLLALAAHRWVVLPRHPDRPARHSLLRALPPAVVILVTLGLYGIAGGQIGSAPDPGDPPAPREPTLMGEGLIFRDPRDPQVRAGDPQMAAGVEDPTPTPRIALIVTLVLLALLTAALAWIRTGSGTKGDAPEEEALDEDGLPDAEATHRAVLHSIDEMLADPDPNTAIIGAYARLLEGLSRSGAPRRDHEGPEEHLQRVLATLQVRPVPLRELVTLFATARFSGETLTPDHRSRALEALRSVAEDLAPVQAPASPAGGTA